MNVFYLGMPPSLERIELTSQFRVNPDSEDLLRLFASLGCNPCLIKFFIPPTITSFRLYCYCIPLPRERIRAGAGDIYHLQE